MVYPPQRPPADWGRAPPPPMMPQERPITIRNITVPILLVVTLVPFLVVSTWKMTALVERITARQDAMDAKHDAHMEALRNRLDQIDEEAKFRSRDRFSRTDHEVWCAKTERLNPGWHCADQPSPMIYYNPHPDPSPAPSKP